MTRSWTSRLSVPTTKRASLSLASFFLASLALGGDAIANWRAPATWTPPRSKGATTLSETPPVPFIPITPCRVADTRGNGFTGAFGPPSVGAGTQRSFPIGGQCGIPVGASAVSFNFTALNVSQAGDLRVYPAGAAVPTVSTLNYNANTPNIANAAVVPLGTGAAIRVQADAATIDLIIDVNGYYSSTLGTPSNFFTLENNSTSYTMFLHNANGTCTNQCGLWTIVDHGTAVWGESSNAGDGVYGVSDNGSGAGVHGVLTPNLSDSRAVWGEHKSTGNQGIGVYGSHAGAGIGVQGDSLATTGTGAIGVLGQAFSTSGGTVGVQGQVFAPLNVDVADSAGVRGVGASGSFTGDANGSFAQSGVRGLDKTGVGVLGLSENLAAEFVLFNSSGGVLTKAFLGTNFSGPNYAVYAQVGDFGGTGAKYFVEPHPTDATKVIRYISLEGPESGTYFRGTAVIQRGQAVIAVPEDFRFVTDDDGLTVQLTPVGAQASMWVASEDLHQIVVRASKDVTFHYQVNGVRRAFKDFQAISEGSEFVPQSANDVMPAGLSAETKSRLIANGTYNPDGTVNLRTAERNGWTKIWQARQDQAKAAAERATVAVPGRRP